MAAAGIVQALTNPVAMQFVSGDKPEDFAAQIDETTKAIYIETIANPSYTVFDIPAFSQLAKDHGIPLIVDNTFGAGGAIASPIKLGADIVVESLTKWIGGHGTTIGGIVVDAGTFPWTTAPKFKEEFTTPAPAYHGVKWSDFGAIAYAIKVRVEVLRDLGACLAPHSAFLLLQGIETLSLRVERHCANTLAVAQHLEKHPAVAYVSRPGVHSTPTGNVQIH